MPTRAALVEAPDRTFTAVVAVIWALVALSYNAELVEGKEKLELANGKLDVTNKELEGANQQIIVEQAALEAERGQ